MNEYEQNIEIMKDLRSKLDKVLEGQPSSTLNIQPKDTSKGHFYVSLVKSVLRFIAGGSIIAAGYAIPGAGWLVAGGALLIGAEVLGIVEEIV